MQLQEEPRSGSRTDIRKAHSASDKGTPKPSRSQGAQRSRADIRSFGRTCLGGPTWLLAHGQGRRVLLRASPEALSNLVPGELGHTDVCQTQVYPTVWAALAAGDGGRVCARTLWPLPEACGRGGGALTGQARREPGGGRERKPQTKAASAPFQRPSPP